MNKKLTKQKNFFLIKKNKKQTTSDFSTLLIVRLSKTFFIKETSA
jgi:hypothetical protein